LLWFVRTRAGGQFHESAAVAPVRDRLLDIVCANLGVNREVAMHQADFLEAGADSLDVVELVMELEEEFEVTIPDDQAEKIRTVGDVVDCVLRQRRG
jgi:acyl carrier protein